MALISDLDDRTLVEQHRAGDPDAFRRIVLRHHRSLYANALRRLNDPVAAEDAVQDAFLRAFRSIERFDGDYHLDAWLHRIVTNTCHDIGRRRGRDTRLFDRACTEVEVEAAPADEALDAMPRDQINHALDSLPETYREVLLLRFVEELPYADVAEKAGISEENARARVSRGRSMLKRMLTSASALVVWAIPPLRRQASLGGAEAEAANQAAAHVHGLNQLTTIATSAPAPTQAFNQVSGLIAQAGPAIATAGPAVSTSAPTLGKAAVAVGIAASMAIPAGVAVDRAREAPKDPGTEVAGDEFSLPAPGAPVTPDTSSPVVAGSSTPAPAPVESLAVGDAEVVAGALDSTTTTAPASSTTTAPAEDDGAAAPAEEDEDGTAPPPGEDDDGAAPAPGAEEPAPQPPPPSTEPAQLSADLQVADGPRLELSGPMAIAVGDRTVTGDLSGKLAVGPADDKDPQAPREVEFSTLYVTVDGTTLELQVRGSTTVSDEGEGTLHRLELAYRLIGAEELGLAESGTTTGTLDVRDGAGSLLLSVPAADGASDEAP